MRQKLTITLAAVGALIAFYFYRISTGERPIADGISRLTLRADDVPIAAVTVDPAKASISLVWQRPDGSIYGDLSVVASEMAQQGKNPVFATNAGIFTSDRVPLGLHVENGIEKTPLNHGTGEGNFYIQPNGVFWIDAAGSAHVTNTTDYRPTSSVRIAMQSGPMLVDRGVISAQFAADSQNRHIRSGVGVNSAGQVIFALSRQPITFNAFARCFRDGLGCANALYLDGAISHVWFADANSPTNPRFAGILVISSP